MIGRESRGKQGGLRGVSRGRLGRAGLKVGRRRDRGFSRLEFGHLIYSYAMIPKHGPVENWQHLLGAQEVGNRSVAGVDDMVFRTDATRECPLLLQRRRAHPDVEGESVVNVRFGGRIRFPIGVLPPDGECLPHLGAETPFALKRGWMGPPSGPLLPVFLVGRDLVPVAALVTVKDAAPEKVGANQQMLDKGKRLSKMLATFPHWTGIALPGLVTAWGLDQIAHKHQYHARGSPAGDYLVIIPAKKG